jgi:hypothetical protein
LNLSKTHISIHFYEPIEFQDRGLQPNESIFSLEKSADSSCCFLQAKQKEMAL